MEKPVTGSIPCPIRTRARSSPDRTAIADRDTAVSYGELDHLISRTIESLEQTGIVRGNVVAVLGFDSIFYAVLFYASIRAGFTLMPLNCRLTESDWHSQLESANAGLCVFDNHYKKYSASLNVPLMNITDLLPERIQPSASVSNVDFDCALDRDALIIFSSGSTGEARGTVLTLSGVYHSALGVIESLQLKPDDSWLAVLPFYHVGGISILLRTALAGCRAYIMSRFDPHEVIRAIGESGLSYVSLVPTMLRDLLQIDDANVLTACKGIVLGGAGWDESLREECVGRDLPILTTYGLTETSSMVTLLPQGSSPDKVTTAGIALPHREVRIVDDSGRAMSPRETGHIAVRGPVLFNRYLNNPASPLDPDGWFVTDDLGRLDEDGYLTVIGRADSIITSGGENIDLNRIEHELSSLPAVTGAVVMARHDDHWGQRPVAFVEVSDDRLTESSILETLSGRLPKIMIPDRIIVVDRLPVTGSGKYDRRTLRRKHRDLF